MKTRMQRWLARVTLSLVAIAAWGVGATAQSLSGVYGGEQCPYRLTFRGKDVVYIQFLAGGKVMQELPGQYKVDGDKVSMTAPNWGAVFTQKGNALETPAMGRTMVCTKLSDVALAQIAGSCELLAPNWPLGLVLFRPDYNKDNICFDTPPILPVPQTVLVQVGNAVVSEIVEMSEAKGGKGWGPGQIQGALALRMPDASVWPTPALLLVSVSRNVLADSARVLFPSNEQTFTNAALDMARSLRWHPAQKHGEAVTAWVALEFRAVPAGASGFISVNVTGAPARPNGLPAMPELVRIDHITVGKTPVINCQVRAGRHTIELKVGARFVFDTVQVDSGATVVKSYDATPR